MLVIIKTSLKPEIIDNAEPHRRLFKYDIFCMLLKEAFCSIAYSKLSIFFFQKLCCPSTGWISLLGNFILLKLSLRGKVPVLISGVDFEDYYKLKELCS